jgi:hypothetical protein
MCIWLSYLGYSFIACQIFEIEDERTCAISDTEDTQGITHFGSQGNNASGRGHSSPIKPSALSASPTERPPRHRATSLLNRPEAAQQQMLSPLAQVFAIPENTIGPLVQQPHGPEEPISSGIAARKRRLSTAHRRVGSGASPRPVMEPTSLLFPPARNAQRNASSGSQPFAASPEGRMSPLETAEQLQEEEGAGVGGPHGTLSAMWAKRLGAIEARQERMEALLERIVKGLQS